MRRILPCALAPSLAGCGSGRAAGDRDGNDASAAVPADMLLDGGVGGLACPSGMALVTFGEGGTVCVDRYEAATVVVAPDGGTAPHPYDQPVDGLTVYDDGARHVGSRLLDRIPLLRRAALS